MYDERIPRKYELVICRIKTINPHSAVAKIVEYDTTGMIHVSEVASRWVRNIKEFIKENQYVVCRVMRSEPGNISLSIKRVRPEEAARKLNEFKRENRAEKLLEMAGKSINKTLEDAKKEIVTLLKEEFGSFTKTFDIAFRNPELLAKKGVPAKWAEAIIDIAKKNYSEKVFVVKGDLELVSYRPDGVEVIRKVLGKAKDSGLKISYISAPKYTISGSGKNFKEVRSKVETAGNEIVKSLEKEGGKASFEMEKN